MLPTINPPLFAYFAGPQDIIVLGIIGLMIIPSIFWIVELIDAARRQFPDPNLKIVWILVILLSHGIGSLIYYFVGKQQGYLPGERPNRY